MPAAPSATAISNRLGPLFAAMVNSSFDDDDATPLDPAVTRVQARLKRLILISGLTLGLGVFAVFAAILYRIVADDASGARAPAALAPGTSVGRLTLSDLGLAADAKLVSTSVDAGRIVLTYSHSGGNTLVFLDGGTLAVVGRLEIVPP